mmetsp:Transcript_7954/g.16962  ORF Transcript_7954/g.16962 Transcript_7954/m.16962 type:complete len:115 (-) Transcript_7954:1085-1429(-)
MKESPATTVSKTADEPEATDKLDARQEEVIHKVEQDRTFKKPHHHHHHHHAKKGENDDEVEEHHGQTVRSLSGVQTPQMFLLNQGLAVESGEFEENDGDSDDFLNLDPLVPGDV